MSSLRKRRPFHRRSSSRRHQVGAVGAHAREMKDAQFVHTMGKVGTDKFFTE